MAEHNGTFTDRPMARTGQFSSNGSAFIRNGRKLLALIGLASQPFNNQGQSNR